MPFLLSDSSSNFNTSALIT
ncbi:hypothetical protein G4B88_006076, partial [Cannabis sativa]